MKRKLLPLLPAVIVAILPWSQYWTQQNLKAAFPTLPGDGIFFAGVMSWVLAIGIYALIKENL